MQPVASHVNQPFSSGWRLSIGDYKRGAYNLQSISAIPEENMMAGSRD